MIKIILTPLAFFSLVSFANVSPEQSDLGHFVDSSAPAEELSVALETKEMLDRLREDFIELSSDDAFVPVIEELDQQENAEIKREVLDKLLAETAKKLESSVANYFLSVLLGPTPGPFPWPLDDPPLWPEDEIPIIH